METTPSTINRPAMRAWDIETMLVAIAGALALIALTAVNERFNPEPLDAEAGWCLCP